MKCYIDHIVLPSWDKQIRYLSYQVNKIIEHNEPECIAKATEEQIIPIVFVIN